MQLNNLLVSVILPVRNEGSYIGKTIESILGQTLQDFEIIIINDASIDDTYDIISKYALRDKRIIIINSDKKLGISGALNKGIAISKGEYIARVDAGDLCLPCRFEDQLRYLNENPDISILGAWAYLIDENEKIIGEWKFPARINNVLLYGVGGIIHPSVIIRKYVFDKLGGYDIKYTVAQDFDLWARAMKNGFNIGNIPKFLIYYRDNTGISYRSLRITTLDTLRIKLKYLPYFFNILNLYFTLRSLLGYICPIYLYKNLLYICSKSKKNISNKKYSAKKAS